MDKDRILVRYLGNRAGPLLVVLGGMHGNEPAGVNAIELMGKMLEVEPIANPDFIYNGTFLGILGNRRAFSEGRRFIDKDLNRLWTKENVEKSLKEDNADNIHEYVEMKEILYAIKSTIEEVQPDRIIVLDLHTTSSFGGIFSICNDSPESLDIAVELHAPVIKGMIRGIQGTTLHYFVDENIGLPTVPISFESGQHLDPLSVNRAIAAITNCMRTIGSVSPQHVENQHDKLLIEYSKDLPKVAELISKHAIKDGDEFTILDGFKNFQTLHKGQLIAIDRHGEILAPEEALILMPLYQKQGDDGFFLVRPIDY